MQALAKSNRFQFTHNQAFEAVIAGCRHTTRHGQNGTWITDAVEQSYIELHKMGFAHSAEAWKDGQLVGGLYGVRIGRVFCGESMFTRVSNASKFAFIQYVQHLQHQGCELIDCQVYSQHLESLGAQMISRDAFLRHLPANPPR